MIELKIVLALALVCLQVSGTLDDKVYIEVYKKLGQCFIENHEGFFHDFFPYRIAESTFSGDAFSFNGRFTNVELRGLENVTIVTIDAKQVIEQNVTMEEIEFNNIFSNIVVRGKLKGYSCNDRYEGSISGSATNVSLEGKVWYKDSKVTGMIFYVTFGKVSIKFDEGETPFNDEHITRYFRNYFYYNKRAIAKKFIQLINARIDTPEKIAKVKKECKI